MRPPALLPLPALGGSSCVPLISTVGWRREGSGATPRNSSSFQKRNCGAGPQGSPVLPPAVLHTVQTTRESRRQA